MKQYEYIEHTADLGLRIYGHSLEELFINACQALFITLIDLDQSCPIKEQSIELKEDSLEDLFIEWLRELLFQFNSEGFIAKDVSIINVSNTDLRADLRGYCFKQGQHKINIEIKAVTYHNLKVEKTNSGYVAEVIFDV